MQLLLLLIVPVIIGLAAYITSQIKGDRYYRITFLEFLCIEAVSVLLVVAGFYIARQYKMTDTEIWSGRIVDKRQVSVPCTHSYSCNCRKDSDNTEHCDTCYEHTCDYDWNLYTGNGETITISRIDRRGSHEPQRFAQAKIHDPTACQHKYTNYIKANPRSLFKRTGSAEKFLKNGLIPKYPINVYDYHYCNRFLPVNASVPDTSWWNRQIQEANADLGPQKQVNIIIIAVGTPDYSYIHALEEAWYGGNKNDIVIILGIPHYPEIEWARVMSWSNSESLKIELRDEITEIGSMEKREQIMQLITEKIKAQFVRRKMADFLYLKAGIQPPAWAMWLLFVISIIASLWMWAYFYRNDPFSR